MCSVDIWRGREEGIKKRKGRERRKGGRERRKVGRERRKGGREGLRNGEGYMAHVRKGEGEG